MNLIDVWRQQISIVTDKSDWKENFKSVIDERCVLTNMSNISMIATPIGQLLKKNEKDNYNMLWLCCFYH